MQAFGESKKASMAAGTGKRIDDKNRLIYTMEGESLLILSCRGHYED